MNFSFYPATMYWNKLSLDQVKDEPADLSQRWQMQNRRHRAQRWHLTQEIGGSHDQFSNEGDKRELLSPEIQPSSRIAFTGWACHVVTFIMLAGQHLYIIWSRLHVCPQSLGQDMLWESNRLGKEEEKNHLSSGEKCQQGKIIKYIPLLISVVEFSDLQPHRTTTQ